MVLNAGRDRSRKPWTETILQGLPAGNGAPGNADPRGVSGLTAEPPGADTVPEGPGQRPAGLPAGGGRSAGVEARGSDVPFRERTYPMSLFTSRMSCSGSMGLSIKTSGFTRPSSRICVMAFLRVSRRLSKGRSVVSPSAWL